MPVYSRLTVINGVLREIAEVPVATEDENNNSKIIADSLSLYLPLFQQSTLDWQFLQKVVVLSTPDTTAQSLAYQYSFTLPVDYLRVIEVNGLTDFKFTGKKILTNSSSVTICYLAFNTSYAAFEAHFIDYFICFIAVRLATPLTRDDKIVAGVGARLENSRQLAAATEFRVKSPSKILLTPKSLVGMAY